MSRRMLFDATLVCERLHLPTAGLPRPPRDPKGDGERIVFLPPQVTRLFVLRELSGGRVDYSPFVDGDLPDPLPPTLPHYWSVYQPFPGTQGLPPVEQTALIRRTPGYDHTPLLVDALLLALDLSEEGGPVLQGNECIFSADHSRYSHIHWFLKMEIRREKQPPDVHITGVKWTPAAAESNRYAHISASGAMHLGPES